jgi:hypothetical protein
MNVLRTCSLKRASHSWTWACLLLAAVALLPTPAFGTAADDIEVPENQEPVTNADSPARSGWRENESCGVTSCLVLLKLSGHAATYDECRRAIPIANGGSTLLAMKQGCQSFGLDVEAILASPTTIDDIQCPFIAHLYPKEKSKANIGHYVVVLSLSKTHVTIIEPNWAPTVEQVPRSDFIRAWSGNVLIRPDLQAKAASRSNLSASMGICTFVICATILITSIGKSKGLASASRLTFTGMLLLGIAALCGCSKTNAATQSTIRANGQPLSITAWKSESDIGPIAQDERACAEFPIENTGRIPVDLEIGKPSCQCASAKLSKPHLAPGEQAVLKMQIENSGKGGNRSANVIVSAKNNPWATAFTIRGCALGAMFLPYDYHLVPDQATNVRGTFYLEHPGQARIVKMSIAGENDRLKGRPIPVVDAPVLGAPKPNGKYFLQDVTIPVKLAEPVKELTTFTLLVDVEVDSKVQHHQCTLVAMPNGSTL